MPENGVSLMIVDDDENMREILAKVLAQEGYTIRQAPHAEAALQELRREPVDVVLSDIRMPGMDGLAFLQQARRSFPEVTVIMMTAFGSVDSAVEAMKQGAYDYISKPFKMDEVNIILSRAVQDKRLRNELRSVRRQLEKAFEFGNLIGKSAEMQKVFDLIRRVANTPATILITGGSGTGKELVAKAIHFNSDRKERPFVPVNCSAIPEDLLESELFGHVKGSFTGAVADKRGLFVEADGGTIFLDEISEMTQGMQAKLLRVLQESEVRRVGDTKSIHVDARVVAATNQDLSVAIRERRFREDLFYRLNVIPVVLPDLKDRVDDIPLLVGHFLKKYDVLSSGARKVSHEALRALVKHHWPGNVRELENAIERAVILSSNEEIQVEDLPPELQSDETDSLRRAEERGATLEELEKDYILLVLERSGGNQTRASEVLGIDRRTLYRKLQRYGVAED